MTNTSASLAIDSFSDRSREEMGVTLSFMIQKVSRNITLIFLFCSNAIEFLEHPCHSGCRIDIEILFMS